MEHALPEPVIAFHEWSGVSWKWFRLKQEIRRRMPTTKLTCPPETDPAVELVFC